MNIGQLGKIYKDGDVVFRQGDPGDTLFVVQHGQVELFYRHEDGVEVALTVLQPGDIFGQIALFRSCPRTVTAVTRGQCRILTLSREAFLSRIHEDPSLAYQALKRLSERIDRLQREMAQLKRPTARPESGQVTT